MARTVRTPTTDPDRVVCLECGRDFRALSGHVYRAHGISLREYRERHRLALTNPLMGESTRERVSAASKRRYGSDPRVREALTSEGARRGQVAGMKALLRERTPEASERIGQQNRARGDEMMARKLADKGFTSFAEAAQWARGEGMTWTRMCKHLGITTTTAEIRAEREGVEAWTIMEEKPRRMLARAAAHVQEHGSLTGTTGELSRWLCHRRYRAARQGDGEIEARLDAIDAAWRPRRR